MILVAFTVRRVLHVLSPGRGSHCPIVCNCLQQIPAAAVLLILDPTPTPAEIYVAGPLIGVDV